MIEGLFWMVVVAVLFWAVSSFTRALKDDAPASQVAERKELVIDRTLMSLIVGVVVFLAVGYLFF